MTPKHALVGLATVLIVLAVLAIYPLHREALYNVLVCQKQPNGDCVIPCTSLSGSTLIFRTCPTPIPPASHD